MPGIFTDTWRIHSTVQQFEAHQSFAWEYRERYEEMAPLLRGRLDESRDIPPGDYDEAQRIAARARAALSAVFTEVDVILTVSAPGAPPKGLDSTGDPTFNRLWTLLGTPCVNVPAIVVDGNLPVGVQVIAGIGDDGKALAAARFVEQALQS
jgi:Asp-tRNA(Asn)/Glu-tRNA(Gln) amidotransferase A subunit family amidase